MRLWMGTLALGALVASASFQPASAASIRWTITNDSAYQAQVSFYSESRSVEWPGGGKSWDLFDNRPHTFNLRCIRGEKICYGAFIYQSHARYWGVGFENANSCADCCGICGAGSMSNTLVR